MANAKATEISIEAQLVLACARARLHADERNRVQALATSSNINWDNAIALAQAHGVLPILSQVLEQTRSTALPTSLLNQLKLNRQGYAQQNLLLLGELLKILSAMRARNISVLAYKGPLLAMLGYGDLSLRQSGDLDILVPPRDVAAAKDVLATMGYAPHTEVDAAAEAEEASANEYHFTYIRTDQRVIVELHWQVVGDAMSFTPNADDLWQRAPIQKIGGAEVRVLSDEDLLMVLCAHGMKHFWTRLGWVCDLGEFIRTHPNINWDLLLSRSNELGGQGIVLVGLLLAERLLGAAIPANALTSTRRSLKAQANRLADHLFCPAAQQDDVRKGSRMQLAGGGVWRSLLMHIQSREDWRSGIRYCLHRLFTPTTLDRNSMKVPAPLRPLYYLVRPLRLAGKYGTRSVTRICGRDPRGRRAA